MTYKIISTLSLVLLLFINSTIVVGQKLDASEIKSKHLFFIAENTIWPHQFNNATHFNIGFLGDEQDFLKKFLKYTKGKKIHDLPIKIRSLYALNNISDINLLYISEDWGGSINKLKEKTQDKHILLISNNIQDKQDIMVNFYIKDNKYLQFEINQANILKSNLYVTANLLLLGGSKLEVLKLFETTLDSLQKARQEVETQQNLLSQINEQLHLKEEVINDLNKDIDIHQSELLKQQYEIRKNISNIDSLRQQYNYINHSLSEKEKAIGEQESRIKEYNDTIDEQKSVMRKNQKEISDRTNKINDQIKILESKEMTIGTQRKLINYITGLLILALLLFIVIIYQYTKKKKINQALREKNERIESLYSELNQSHVSLKSTHEELQQQKEELVATLEKLKSAQKQLVQSEKMASLGVLTAGIAHEINNPVNFIYGGVNNISRDMEDIKPVINKVNQLQPQDQDLPQKIKEIIQLKKELEFQEAVDSLEDTIKHIKLGSDRITEIVSGLRKFSRIETDEWQTANIHEEIDNVLVLLKNKYKNHVQITKNYHDNAPQIQCLPGKINQVLMNILSNAIDSIKEKGLIDIETMSDSTSFYISIEDNGSGISEENQKKIFDPFFTTKEVGKGMGLGLSLTYSIIEEHNGEISVQSEVNKGTTFMIKLPLIQTQK